jgi:hypothetical protein
MRSLKNRDPASTVSLNLSKRIVKYWRVSRYGITTLEFAFFSVSADLILFVLVSQRAIRTDTINDLVQALLNSDFDRSATFSDSEIENDLEISLMMVPGITVNHELLVERIKATDRDMASVLALLREIDNDDLVDEERIFRVDIDERKKQSLNKAN